MHFGPMAGLLVLCGLLSAQASAAQKPELSVQTGHSAAVTALAFSNSGDLLASGSVDASIVLWDPATGTQLRTLRGHLGTIEALAFTADGTLLISASADNSIKIWDVTSGREQRVLLGHSLAVTSLAVSADGRTLASGSADQSVKVWDLATGRELRTLQVAPKAMAGLPVNVEFSPDGKILASGGAQVTLWEVATGQALRTLKRSDAGTPAETPLAFSVDGRTLATGGATVRLWEVATGTAQSELGAQAMALSFSPDHRTLASSDRADISLWNLESGREVRKLTGTKLGIEAIRFSPDGRILASANDDNTLTLWDVDDGRPLRVLQGHVAAVVDLALSADNRVLASAADPGLAAIAREDNIKVWDPVAGQFIRSLLGRHHGYSIGLSGDGSRLISGSSGNAVSLWKASQGDAQRILAAPRESQFVADRVALSFDGRLAAAGGRDHMIRLWDAASGREIFTLKGHQRDIRALAFSPDGHWLASAGSDATTRLWSTATGAQVKNIPQQSGAAVLALAFSPDGKRLAIGGADRMVLIWSVSTAEYVAACLGHPGAVRTVAFGQDGQTLASADDTGEIRLWSIEQRAAHGVPVVINRPLHILHGHAGPINSLAFAAAGKLLFSGGEDARLKLWDAREGNELATLLSLDQRDWLVVTPDGLFDGSPAAWNQILWRFSPNLFDVAPVEVFFNEYFYPGLLAELYAGKRPQAPRNIAQMDRRQPAVKILAATVPTAGTATIVRTARISVDIGPAAAGAQDVRLFRNGALVRLWPGDVLKGHGRVRLEATVPVVAGDNVFTAYAFNHDDVKSADATLRVSGSERLRHPGTLFVLSVAVNHYANAEFDLGFAVADAMDFAGELTRQAARLKNFAQTTVIALTDAQATKANILKALGDLAARVEPEDGVAFYYAGHGTAQHNQFYLIPHDLGYSGGRDQIDDAALAAVVAHSISDRELASAFERIDAGEFLFVIDACNSGQALEGREKRRGPMNSKGLAQLAYEKGIYILTAAQSYQAALESSDLQHGLLTYVLIEEGLKQQAADAEPKDGVLFANEWFSFATTRVPQMQQERMRRASQGGRQLAYVEGEEATAAADRNVQRPRVFYRRELEEQPFVIARFSAAPAP